jgi:hypothetical protein
MQISLMNSYYFCTYFDSNYLSYGLTLIRSLQKQCKNSFTMYVLCLDEETYESLKELKISSVELIKLSEIEKWDDSLLKVKNQRSVIEYYFTLSPILPLYILKKFNVDIITSLDADIMFFESPKSIYKALQSKSIYIIEHRFRPNYEKNLISGRFNVQCQLFRNNEIGLNCLNRWRKQCLEWCFDRHEDGKFADQKYLDEWPSLYGDELVVSQNLGEGLATWNIDGENIAKSNNGFLINDNPVIFFHFHGLKVFNRFIAKTGLSAYKTPLTKALREMYIVYISNLFINNFKTKKTSLRGSSYGTLRIFLSGIKNRDLIIKLDKF